jgi:hypothetical protein
MRRGEMRRGEMRRGVKSHRASDTAPSGSASKRAGVRHRARSRRRHKHILDRQVQVQLIPMLLRSRNQ